MIACLGSTIYGQHVGLYSAVDRCVQSISYIKVDTVRFMKIPATNIDCGSRLKHSLNRSDVFYIHVQFTLFYDVYLSIKTYVVYTFTPMSSLTCDVLPVLMCLHMPNINHMMQQMLV